MNKATKEDLEQFNGRDVIATTVNIYCLEDIDDIRLHLINKYGQESNVFYISPLLYTSSKDRGGSSEEKFANSFEITIDNFDSNFDYLRLYSIFRSSIDGTIDAKFITDMPLRNLDITSPIKIIDNNNLGSSIDYTELLYKGGESITALTMDSKDNTLFLGNIKLINEPLSEEIIDKIKSNITGEFVYKTNGMYELKLLINRD